MNWDRTNQFLQIGANLALLAGLILVGVQISETNRITNAQFIADDYATTMSTYELIIGESLSEALGKAQVNSVDLTNENLVVVHAYLAREWYRSVRDRAISETGYTDVNFELDVTEWAFSNLGNETALRWWTLNQNGMLNLYPELREAVNERIAGQGETHKNFHQRRTTELQGGSIYPQKILSRFQ